MFTSKMDKKNRIVKTWSPTRTMRAMGVGTQISLPLVMVGSPQAMYMAKMRLNAECGWEQWLVKVTEVIDAKGMLMKHAAEVPEFFNSRTYEAYKVKAYENGKEDACYFFC